jgi:hypothetical protein
MRSRLLMAASAAALLALGACADSTTAPRRFDPNLRRMDISPGPDGSCRSGYRVAARPDGTQGCEEN